MKLADLCQDPLLVSALFHTAWKVVLLMLLLIPVGLLLGFAIGLSSRIYDFLRPLVLIIQAVPVISWLTLVVFMWGISWQGPLFIGFLSLLPLAALTTAAGVQDLNQNLLEMARLYKVPFLKIFRYIYLGSLRPFIKAIIDISIGNAWKVIIVAEYLVGDNGLGVQIAWARQFVDVPRVYALTLITVAAGLLSERVIKWQLNKNRML